MKIGELCNREVVVAFPMQTVADAAQLMREHHVGCLVVVADRDGARVPVGMVTDRDIVVAVVAKEVDPRTLTVEDIMATTPFLAHERDDSAEALRTMLGKGVRRLPVVSQDGTLVGLVTLDDMVEFAAEEIGNLARTPGREQSREARLRP